MKILFFGDISGKTGRLALQKALPDLEKKYQPDFIIANGENATHGKGINKNAYDFLVNLGIDCITSGDHIFDVKEIEEFISNENSKIIRPANYPQREEIPGRGFTILEKNNKKVAVINLQGRIFMDEGLEDPFIIADKIISKQNIESLPIFIDFHCEATSEINALGWFLDGKVSVIAGTHTHIQTNDVRILPNGTGYISDVGMCGAYNSVIGVEKEIIINKFLTGLPIKQEIAGFPAIVSGIFVEIDKNNHCSRIENINEIIEK